jgi:hypothetical protein
MLKANNRQNKFFISSVLVWSSHCPLTAGVVMGSILAHCPLNHGGMSIFIHINSVWYISLTKKYIHTLQICTCIIIRIGIHTRLVVACA